MATRKGLPRVRKSKNTQYRRTLLKFNIPSVFNFVHEKETELEPQKPFSAQTLAIRKVLGNPWVVGISTGFIVWVVTSFYW